MTHGHIRTGLRRILEFSLVYNTLQNIVGAHRVRTRVVSEFIRPCANAKILDVACGTGTMLDYLPESVRYVGYDLNPRYISSAKKKYKDRGHFSRSAVSEAAVLSPGDFDIVLAIGILHHLNDKEALALIMSAHGQLRKGGVLISIDPVLTHNQTWIARYLISMDRGQCVRSPGGYMNLAKKQFNRVESAILTGLSRIPWTHYAMRCTKDS